jgi:hypothetical protein
MPLSAASLAAVWRGFLLPLCHVPGLGAGVPQRSRGLADLLRLPSELCGMLLGLPGPFSTL